MTPGKRLFASSVLLAAAGGLAFGWSPRVALAAWLMAWWVCMSLGLGALATLYLHRLTGGRWGRTLRPVFADVALAVPPLAALVLPLLWGVAQLYPWAQGGWYDAARMPEFREAWRDPAWFALRGAACALAWGGLAWITTRRPAGARTATARRGPASLRAGFAAGGLLLLGYTSSFAAFDLLMSLDAQWYSTGFGLITVVAQLKLAMAWGAWCAARPAAPARRADFGNLLLMYVMTYAYLEFTQFQIIWAENLPHEIGWYLPRFIGPARGLGWTLIVAGFAVPLTLLLWRRVKRSASGLRGISGLLLAMSGIEVAWWVLPGMPDGHVATPLLALGFLLGMAWWAQAWIRLQRPVASPRAWASHA